MTERVTVWLPGQEAALRTLLVDAGGRTGWGFAGARIERDQVRAGFRRSPDASVLVIIRPGSPHPDVSAPDGDGAAALLAAIRRALRQSPSVLRAGEAGAIAHGTRTAFSNPDLVAARAGLKPALRESCSPTTAEAVEARLRGAGLHVARLGQAVTLQGEPRDVVYASREPGRARALRNLEAAFLRQAARIEDTALAARINAEIGRHLGYPDCCIAAFGVRLQRIRTLEKTDRYLAVVDAWVPSPHPRLNDLLLGIGVWWIPFEPCRYDCPAALRYADAAAALLETEDAPSVSAIDALLARPVLVPPQGHAAWAELNGDAVVGLAPIDGPVPDLRLPATIVGGIPVGTMARVLRFGPPAG